MLHYAVIKIKRFWDADGRYSTQTFVNIIVVNLSPKGNFRQIKPWECYFCGKESLNGSIESSFRDCAHACSTCTSHFWQIFSHPSQDFGINRMGGVEVQYSTTGAPELRGIASPLLF